MQVPPPQLTLETAQGLTHSTASASAGGSSAFSGQGGPLLHPRSALPLAAGWQQPAQADGAPNTWQGAPQSGLNPPAQGLQAAKQRPLNNSWQGPTAPGRSAPAGWSGSGAGTGQQQQGPLAAQRPPAGAPQRPSRHNYDYSHAESSLLVDLDDIADAFGHETFLPHPGPPCWAPQQAPSKGRPPASIQKLPQEAPPQGAPQEPPHESIRTSPSPSRAAETFAAVCSLPDEAPPPETTGRVSGAFMGQQAAACGQSQIQQPRQSEDTEPFWLFGAVLDARKGRGDGRELELLMTDGMKVFLAFAQHGTADAMMSGVKQTGLFSPISPIEQLKSVQGHFLLNIRGQHANKKVHILSFRANAPSREVTEKIKFLYSAITGKTA